ncbi:MAG TPA: hypothetical protein VMJ32_12610 [Pirellulales bacterium]|nr:hypothetical protein [Pirellulales bacterium]
MTWLTCAGCQKSPSAAEPLVTGKTITPRLSMQQNVGNLPMNIALSPDGLYAVTTDMGNRQALWSIRTTDGVGVSHVDFQNKRKSAKSADKKGESGEAAEEETPSGSPYSIGLYYGLAFSKDGLLYAAQGGHDSIAVLSLAADGQLKLLDSIATKPKDFPAGLAIDNRGWLYVGNNASGGGNPLKLTASMAVYDPASHSELGRYTFSESYGGTSNFPLALAVQRDGGKTYVAAERDDCVYVLGTTNPAQIKQIARVPTGAHPDSVLLTQNGDRLFVANSLGDTISILDTAANRVTNTILLRPALVRDLPGATPTGMALSLDEKQLYVALGDMNAVAVIDVPAAKVLGFIPAGWYPTAVAMTAPGQLLVVNAKGTKLRSPDNMPDPYDSKRKHAYIGSLLNGIVGLVSIPTGDDLDSATQQVLKNNRLDNFTPAGENPLAGIGLAAGKIKHVIYIIKENRTYDEVLGDLPQGNGDPSLVLFGREVTPNQHALAERFVLLDSLYACGEVSGDGWCWSTQGMADAYVVRNVPYAYSDRGRKFDFEGENNGYPTGGVPGKDEAGQPLSAEKSPFRAGVPPVPDVANTGRNIWDAAREAGLSLRNYGFFLYFADGTVGLRGGPDNYPVSPGLQPPGHNLAGITDADFRRFDLDYPDSDAPQTVFQQSGESNALFNETTYGKYEMPSRFAEWNREFQMMLAKNPAGAAVPALTLVRLGVDHTSAASAGKHTPRSCVADNDYAVGQLVEAVSHSPIWNSTAICIIEDDAQSGADHVDCHRTTAYIASPWIKAHSVDHHFYNTDSLLKTMEFLLGLKPLSQYDAVADPILDWDASPTNAESFQAIMPSAELIAQRNPRLQDLGAFDPRREMVVASTAMDFTHADAAPAKKVNEIIWRSIKGINSPVPLPRGIPIGDDDDDEK